MFRKAQAHRRYQRRQSRRFCPPGWPRGTEAQPIGVVLQALDEGLPTRPRYSVTPALAARGRRRGWPIGPFGSLHPPWRLFHPPPPLPREGGPAGAKADARGGHASLGFRLISQ